MVSCSPCCGSWFQEYEPVHRRGGERVGGAGQRDVALAGEQPRGRVETHPARSGKVDLGPGVQVGEVVLRPRRAVERGDVRLELDQVSRDEPGRQPELPRGAAPAAMPCRGTSRCPASSVSSQV